MHAVPQLWSRGGRRLLVWSMAAGVCKWGQRDQWHWFPMPPWRAATLCIACCAPPCVLLEQIHELWLGGDDRRLALGHLRWGRGAGRAAYLLPTHESTCTPSHRQKEADGRGWMSSLLWWRGEGRGKRGWGEGARLCRGKAPSRGLQLGGAAPYGITPQSKELLTNTA